MFSWLDKRSLFSMALLCFSKRFRWVIVRCSSSSRFFCQRFSTCEQAKILIAKSTKFHYSQTTLAIVWVFIAQLVQHCSTKTQSPWVRIPLGPKIFFGLIICHTLQVKPSFVVFSEEEKRRLSESQQTFEVAAARTSGLVNLVLSCQTGFLSASILFLINRWS